MSDVTHLWEMFACAALAGARERTPEERAARASADASAMLEEYRKRLVLLNQNKRLTEYEQGMLVEMGRINLAGCLAQEGSGTKC